MPDHLHVLIGLRPSMALTDLVREIKADSSNFINKNKWVRGKFSWQEGYGAFLLRTLAIGYDHEIYPKSREASSPEDV